MSTRLQMAIALAVILAVAWVVRSPAEPSPAPQGPPPALRHGLLLAPTVWSEGGMLVTELRIENRRSRPVLLAADRCGAVGRVELRRTRPEPAGRTWTGSVEAVKRLVLRSRTPATQPFVLEGADRCRPHRGHVRLEPGAVIHERWELRFPYLLDVVGARGATVRSQIDGIRVDAPAAQIVDHPATPAPDGPPAGEWFDRVLADPSVRTAIAAQPRAGWLDARLTRLHGEVRLTALHRAYRRRFEVTAGAAGTVLATFLPGSADRARVYPTRPAARPPGTRVIPEADGYVLTRDALLGRVALPSGRLVADGSMTGDAESARHRVPAASYPVRLTLASSPQGGETVALATVLVSRRKTVAWRHEGGVGTDGATAIFTSPEAEARLARRLRSDDEGWLRWLERAGDEVQTSNAGGTVLPGGIAMFTTGSKDGGYPMRVGLDAAGRPTRFVLDFFVVHLRWPRR
jgi:uncharacterized protein DUF4241